jgi:hypothetical protein
MAAAQRPLADATFSEKSGVPAWKTIPSWAVVATADNVIGTANARFMAQRRRPDHGGQRVARGYDLSAQGGRRRHRGRSLRDREAVVRKSGRPAGAAVGRPQVSR